MAFFYIDKKNNSQIISALTSGGFLLYAPLHSAKGGVFLSNRIYKMDECLEYGRKGEEEVYNFFSGKQYVKNIIDLRDNPIARQDDVDFGLIFIDGTCHSVEVKTDSYSYTNNVFVEELSNKDTGTTGCFMKTKAEFIVYYFPKEGIAYIINTKRFRNWYMMNKSRFRLKDNIWNMLPDGRRFSSSGRIIPRSIFELEGWYFLRKHQIAKSEDTDQSTTQSAQAN